MTRHMFRSSLTGTGLLLVNPAKPWLVCWHTGTQTQASSAHRLSSYLAGKRSLAQS